MPISVIPGSQEALLSIWSNNDAIADADTHILAVSILPIKTSVNDSIRFVPCLVFDPLVQFWAGSASVSPSLCVDYRIELFIARRMGYLLASNFLQKAPLSPAPLSPTPNQSCGKLIFTKFVCPIPAPINWDGTTSCSEATASALGARRR